MDQIEQNAVVQELTEARAKIADFSCWTSHEYARGADGQTALPWGRVATQYDAVGALICVNPEWDDDTPAIRALIDASEKLFGLDALDLNDSSAADPAERHAKVLKAFDVAIADARIAEPSHAEP